MTTRIQDIPGSHRLAATLPAFTAASDDGLRQPIAKVPFGAKVNTIEVYFQGTASVTLSGSDTAKLIAYAGTVPIGTAQIGTVTMGNALTVFSGTRSVDADTLLWIQYGTVGSGINLPESLAVVTLKAA